jgi:selenide, water dikinase
LGRRLTDYAACGGCASKLAAGELARVLLDLPVPDDERVIVDFRTHDDAGVFRIDASTTLVQTVDFFTPIVDEPYDYGQIAAANAVSDVYAMGGRPLTALAIAALPASDIEPAVVKAIFQGGFDKLREAGIALLGGHTVRDTEIKFGYAITGTVDPARVWSNTGARAGDVLVLTKPIGTGIVSTAIKRQLAPPALASTAIASMKTLNRVAAETLLSRASAVHACTDVTGFSLMGHGSEMAIGSGVTLAIDPDRVPCFEGVEALAIDCLPGGGRTNQAHFEPRVHATDPLAESRRALLFDPQTSGGLLVALAEADADSALAALRAAGVPAAWIGRVLPPRADGAAILLERQ